MHIGSLVILITYLSSLLLFHCVPTYMVLPLCTGTLGNSLWPWWWLVVFPQMKMIIPSKGTSSLGDFVAHHSSCCLKPVSSKLFSSCIQYGHLGHFMPLHRLSKQVWKIHLISICLHYNWSHMLLFSLPSHATFWPLCHQCFIL